MDASDRPAPVLAYAAIAACWITSLTLISRKQAAPRELRSLALASHALARIVATDTIATPPAAAPPKATTHP
jgi:hypothetical protein